MEKPPEPTAGDAAHAIARAAVSAIPYAGGAVVELLNALITPPLERRRQQWMTDVSEALKRLETDRGINLEALKENEVFVDTVLKASYAALRDHQAAKREALKNAILNAALPNPPDEAYQQIFVTWVDQFTVWHLRILSLMRDPAAWFAGQGRTIQNVTAASLAQLVEAAFPELRGQRPLYDQIWRDLNQAGLVNTPALQGMMTGTGVMAPRTTDLGTRFIRFISAP